MTKLEIACFTKEAAFIAADEGADRIELCEGYAIGGITPPADDFLQLRAYTSIPIYVMIRPRAGDFIYSEKEFRQMQEALDFFKEAGADGFVFGILNAEGKIDWERNKILVAQAHGKPCTFHRAFDSILHKKEAIRQLISCGFKNVLTSGGKDTAEKGLQTLNQLKKWAGKEINILPGGGIRSANSLLFTDNFDFIHTACVKPGTDEIDREELTKLKKQLI